MSTRRLPGFGLSMGITVFWLSFVVLVPLIALFARAAGIGFSQWVAIFTDARVLSAFRLSLSCALAAALLNAVFGPMIAWVLVRYPFPGRAFADALIDLPFALPTAVAGITLASLWSPRGWLGAACQTLGIQVAYTPLGIVLALAFVGLPFAVRTVQPILEELPSEIEEAAAMLGASRLQVIRRIVFPAIRPAILAGFALSFARGLGEFGSVIFIAGNVPRKTEIAPLLVMQKLEEFKTGEAAALGAAILLLSFALLFPLNWLQSSLKRSR